LLRVEKKGEERVRMLRIGAIFLVVASLIYLYYRDNRNEGTWTAAEDAGQPQLSKAFTSADDPHRRESEIADILHRSETREPEAGAAGTASGAVVGKRESVNLLTVGEKGRRIWLGGDVLNARTRKPVPHAMVTVRAIDNDGGDSEALHRTAQANSDGKFRFDVPAGLRFDLKAAAEGFRTTFHRHMVAYRPSLNLTILLDPVFDLNGRVVDTQMRPVPDSAVWIRGAAGESGRATALSDEDGWFTLPSLEEGEYDVGAAHASFTPLDKLRISIPHDGDIVLVMEAEERLSSIVGKVEDGEDETPIAGAHVTVLDIAQKTGLGQAALADELGFYEISGVKPGDYLVSCRAEGYGRSFDHSKQITIEENREYRVDCRLRREHIVSGVVLAEQGTPIAKATALVEPVSGGMSRLELSDRDGTFTITNTVADMYRLTVSHQDYVGFQSVITVPVSDDLEITLKRGAEVRGFVSYTTGMPIEEFRIAFASPISGMVFKGARIKAIDGYFEVRGLEPQVYDLRIELPDGKGASGLLDTYGSLTVRMFMDVTGASNPLEIEVVNYQ
jgi:hypothetical protein